MCEEHKSKPMLAVMVTSVNNGLLNSRTFFELASGDISTFIAPS